MPLEQSQNYFEFLAELGLTKHIGSMRATRELVQLCRIGHSSYVLDVGCGVGPTPCYLAKTHGSRVVGIDLLKKMVAQSRARANAEGVTDQVKFLVADARRLPFEDAVFDAVIMESVNVFFEDKLQAMRDYVRVTKPGGYVGITEMTWLTPPTPEAVEYYRRTVFADVLQAEAWKTLLEDAGLRDVTGNAYHVDMAVEGQGRFQRYGCRGMLKVLWQTVKVFFKDPASRDFLKDVTSSVPKDMLRDMGYGVYAGRKI